MDKRVLTEKKAQAPVMDFAVAKTNHRMWKIKLRQFLEGRETIDEAVLVSHRHCALGKWLYSEGLKKYKDLPEIHRLEKVHANLHYLVKTIVQLKKKGNELQAEQEYQKIGEVSDEIISLLNAIERQVSASQTASSRASNEQEKKRILHERAQILAQKPKRDANGGAAYLSVVLFSLADETYALELGHVREVYTLEDLTPLPCTPPFIIGIINVRGQIFSVVDLKKLFNLPDQERTDLSKAILIEAGGMAFGVLANLILGVQSISLKAIQPPPPTLTGFQAEYVKGITNEPVIILNALKILADERLVVYEEVAG